MRCVVLLVVLTRDAIMTKNIKKPIACRDLLWNHDKDVERSITVAIYTPAKNRGVWRCDYAIHIKDGKTQRDRAVGEDSIQVLLLAIEGLRQAIESLGGTVTWNNAEKGDHGVSRLILAPFGLAVTREIHRTLDREVARIVKPCGAT